MAAVGTATCPDTGKLVLVIRFDEVSELHSFRNICRKNSSGGSESTSYYTLLDQDGWKQDTELSRGALYNVMQGCVEVLSNK